jgi:hypothetical protein
LGAGGLRFESGLPDHGITVGPPRGMGIERICMMFNSAMDNDTADGVARWILSAMIALIPAGIPGAILSAAIHPIAGIVGLPLWVFFTYLAANRLLWRADS